MISYEGEPINDVQKQALLDFAAELAGHPRGGKIDGRIVHAKQRPGGITATMRNALQPYMKHEDFKQWEAAETGRTVATGGKTFVADDEVITAVLHPLPGMAQEFIDLGAHELVEMAILVREQRDHWVPPDDPDEADGLVLLDEYCNERVRQEIRDRLGWPEGGLDASPGLVSMTDDIANRMPKSRLDPPAPEFWPAWLAMARVWAMVCGRAGAGSESARRELTAWADHALIADEGWAPVAVAADSLYRQPELDRDLVAGQAGNGVRSPIIAYGRRAWHMGP